MSTIKVDNLQTTGGAGLYPARAWVNFNGTGTVAIREDGNVSSITDNTLGDYTVNFATAITDANYAMSGMCQSYSHTDAGAGVQPILKATSFTASPTLKTTTQCAVLFGNTNRYDFANNTIIFAR